MKTLILMRHAKSSWDAPGLSDHDRPLNTRGQRSAKALGDWLRQKRHAPDQALVSSAVRTQATAEGLGLSVAPATTRRLYLADAGTMRDVLRTATGDTVLMIGHNPGIAHCAHQLVRTAPDHDRFDDYPTGATLVAAFDVARWGDLIWHSGTPLNFVIPRELTS